MAFGSSKSNVMAVVVEVTEGTPVDPSAATDYVVLQPDATLTPNFELLQNEEIRASIGAAKGIQGLERPEGSFSHYLKHSGTEGAEPETHEILKAAFGSTSTNSTQRTTTTSSTTSLIKLASGGSDFARGKAILIKDGTNGYSIRPVDSVSSNDLTLGFNLTNAPASGVNVGKCINYAPANSGHQALSMHLYRGNGTAKELLAGAKVTEFGFTANAGEFINSRFAFVGSKYHFNPVRVGSSNKLDFYNGTTDYTATITAGVYRDPHELASTITDAMNTAAGTSSVYACTFNSSGASAGKFTITKTSGTFTIKWNTGTNTGTSIASTIGFSTAADSTGALTYTSATAQTYGAPHTPSYDSVDPIAAKYQEILLGDSTDTTAFEAQSVEFTMTNERTEVKSICAQSGINSILVTGREVTIRCQALIAQHDADKFRRYRANTDTKFLYNFGNKSGGNWVAGQCGCLYIPTCTITSFELADLDTLIGLSIELKAFVDSSGNGEVYLNFL